MLKHFGLTGSILAFVTAVTCALSEWCGPDLTISQHIAFNVVSIWIFRVIGVISAGMILANLLGYVKARYGLGRVFSAIVIAICGGMALFCLFPFTEGISAIIHDISAYTTVAMGALLSLGITVSLWWRSGWPLRIIGIVGTTYAVFMIATSCINYGFFLDNIFYIETGYYLWLLVLLSTMSYLKPKKRISDKISS